MKKKIILGILTSASSVAPIAGVISCGDLTEEKDNNKKDAHSNGSEQTTGTQQTTPTPGTNGVQTTTSGTAGTQQTSGNSGTSQGTGGTNTIQQQGTSGTQQASGNTGTSQGTSGTSQQPVQQPQQQPAPQQPQPSNTPIQTQPQQSSAGSAPLTTGTTIVPPALSSDIPQPTSYEVVPPTTLNGNDGKILIKGIDMNTYTVPQIIQGSQNMAPIPPLVPTPSSTTNEGEIDGLSPGKYDITLYVKDRTKTFAGTFGDKEIHYSFTVDYAPAGVSVFPNVQLKSMRIGGYGFSKQDGSSVGIQSAYYMTMTKGGTLTSSDFENAYSITNADGSTPYATFTWENGKVFDPNVVGDYRIIFVAKVDNTNPNYPAYNMMIHINVHN